MKKFKIETWKSRVPKYDKSNKIVGYDEADESLLSAFNVLIASKKPEEMPRGLDKFRLFGRLSKAFEEAEKTKTLNLEEIDYKFIKDMLDSDVPAYWGMNKNLNKAIEAFLNVKEE